MLKFTIPSAIGFSSWIVSGRSVTMDEAKSSSVNTQRSTGHSPLFRNPFIAVSIVAALGNDMPTRDAICSVRCAGFSLSFDAIADAMYAFSSLKKVTSRGYIR
jgi:hypothetical protein